MGEGMGGYGVAIWWGFGVRIWGICSEDDMGIKGIVGYGGRIWG